MTQATVLPLIRDHLLALTCPHPLRLAIDGMDAAGKTTLADALAEHADIIIGNDDPQNPLVSFQP